jgi:uncharacterized protein (TIGR03435 family)
MTISRMGLVTQVGGWIVIAVLAHGQLPGATSPKQDEQVGRQANKLMPADADPSYEVATIKLSNPENKNGGIDMRGRHMVVTGQSAEDLVKFAYGVHAKQIVNRPDWLAIDKVDIDGVLDVEGQPNLKQMQTVVKKLLADRFQLKFHRDRKELAVYALEIAKGGPKLTRGTADRDEPGNENASRRYGIYTMKVENNSMSDFAQLMQLFVDRPVVDQTRLEGKWDFQWSWIVDESRAPSDANAPPGMFTAIQEQLGLKLEATKATTDVLVIDDIEPPSPN